MGHNPLAMKRPLFHCGWLLLGLLAAAPAALADPAPEEQQKEPGADEPFWRTGHQLTVEMGGGGDAGDLTAPNFYAVGGNNTYSTGLGAATAIHYSYRFNPWISFGPRVFYYFMDAEVSGAASTSDDSAFVVGVDFAVTGYPLKFSRFDPFAGLSVGYAMWTVPVIDPGGGDSRHNYRLHGVTLQLNLGVDIYVTQYFSVGPVFRYHFPFWIQYCATGPGDKCERTEDLASDVKDSFPDLVFVGAQAVFHIR